MGSKTSKQVQNSNKNTNTKHFEGDRVFVGCNQSYFYEFSMIGKTVHNLGQVLKGHVGSMAKTPDNKSQFLCADYNKYFIELDIATRKQVNSF